MSRLVALMVLAFVAVTVADIKIQQPSDGYTIGKRVSGDRTLLQKSDFRQYPTPRDVRINLSYPSNIGDQEATISCVKVFVRNPSNNDGITLLSGGIGQRFISVDIVGKNTTAFGYTVSFYGY